MNEQQPRDPAEVAWDAFRVLTATTDRETFQQAYVGSWPNATAFGEQLLADYDAGRYLARLPTWLQRLVRIDSAAFVGDFTQAGYYHLVEADGLHVFDGPLWRELTTCKAAVPAGQYA